MATSQGATRLKKLGRGVVGLGDSVMGVNT